MRLLEEGDLKLPWRDSFYAIKGGQFEMLKWLRQLGCPWPLLTNHNAKRANAQLGWFFVGSADSSRQHFP